MTPRIEFNVFDDIGKIKDIMESTPPNPLKALEAEYEIALTMLAARLPLGTPVNITEQEEIIAKRLARHFLFNYNTGFSVLKFTPPYNRQSDPSARQRALEDAIQKLANLDPSREMMSEWLTTALEGRLHRTLREFLNAHKPTANPRHALSRIAARIAFSGDLEVIGRMSQSAYKTVDFGVGGYYLLFKSTKVIRQQEFEALLGYARRVLVKHRQDDVPKLVEVARVLSIPSISPEQKDELLRFVFSILDVEHFPLRDPDDDIIDPMARLDVITKKMGFSAPIRTVIKLIAKIFEKRLREDAERSREIQKNLHPHPDQEELASRRALVAQIVGILSNQSDDFLSALEDSKLFPSFSGEHATNLISDSWMSKEILTDTLVSALTHEPSLRILAKHLPNDLPDDTIKTLRESDVVIDKPVAQLLVRMIRERSESPRWVRQVLENIPALAGQVEYWMSQILPTEKNPTVLGALIALHENLAFRQHKSASELQDALILRLMQLLPDIDVSLDSRWLAWFARLGRVYLRRILVQIASAWQSDDSSAVALRHQNILREFSRRAEEMQDVDAVTLAACLLVDPDDWSERGCSLPDRVQQAIAFLSARDTDRSTQERIARLLDTAIMRRPQARQIIVRALRTMFFPDLALPLLQLLMDIATDQNEGTWDWHETRRKLYAEAVKSLAALKPLSARVILLLQHAFSIASARESPFHLELTPSFVYDELLPLLTHDVSPDAVPVLVEMVWRNHCGPLIEGKSPCVGQEGEPFLDKFDHPSWRLAWNEKIHRYLHIYESEGYNAEGQTLLCALQALANVTDLNLPQQRVIWRVYRTSWNALTKSLCLLILGRQRPVQDETVRELIGLLRRDPWAEFWRTTIKHVFRYLLFRVIIHSDPPDSDLNYLYLCQSVAVDRIGALLTQERDDPVVVKYRENLEKALVAMTSMSRYGMEPHLSGYTSMGSGTTGTRGIAQMMGASQEEEERLTWIAHPSDRAYHVLREIVSVQAM